MRLRDKILGVGRIIGAVAPIIISSYGGLLYAQGQQLQLHEDLLLDRRISTVEINAARQEERWAAVVARLDAQDKTLWWLVVATFGGTSVSGFVAADRAAFKWKQARGT